MGRRHSHRAAVVGLLAGYLESARDAAVRLMARADAWPTLEFDTSDLVAQAMVTPDEDDSPPAPAWEIVCALCGAVVYRYGDALADQDDDSAHKVAAREAVRLAHERHTRECPALGGA